MKFSGGFLFFSLITGFGSYIFELRPNIDNYYLSKELATTEATINSIGCHHIGSKSGWSPEIKYSYVVSGKEFISTQFSNVRGLRSGYESGCAKLIKGITKNSIQPIYYNFKSPEYAIFYRVHPPHPTECIFTMLFLMFFTLFSVNQYRLFKQASNRPHITSRSRPTPSARP